MNGAVLSSAALGALISGKSDIVVLEVWKASATTAAHCHRYGTTAANDFRTLRSQPSAGRLTKTFFPSATNTVWTANAGANRHLKVPTCLAYRYSASGPQPILADGAVIPGAFTGTPAGGTFGNRTFFSGSDTNGTSAFPGVLGLRAICLEALSDYDLQRAIVSARTLAGIVTKRVMILGHSIPANNSVVYAQSRAALQGLIDADIPTFGRRLELIGDFSPAQPTFDLDYCFAGGGNQIPTLTGYLTSSTYDIAHAYPCDVMWIEIVTNDIANAGLTPAQCVPLYDAMLDAAQAAQPGVRIVAEQELARLDAHNTAIQDWNANYLPGVVASAQGRGINVVMRNTMSSLTGLPMVDDVHPGVAAAPAIAANMYTTLLEEAGFVL